MKSLLTMTLALAALLVGALVLADDGDVADRDPRFHHDASIDLSVYDLDGDGSISREEYDAAGGLFDLLDRNGDGRLGPRELSMTGARRPHGHHRPGGLFRRADADGDRVITATEWDAFLPTLDPDGDGAVERPGRGGTDACGQRPRREHPLDPDGDCVIRITDLRNLSRSSTTTATAS